MSDDIVADLRSYTERFELSPRIQSKLMLMAADEIDRLRVVEYSLIKISLETEKRLEAEIERLREDRKRMTSVIMAAADDGNAQAAKLAEAKAEIEQLRRWVFATAVSLDRSGLTIEEYNAITANVKAT